jgi:25S rRNA (adenine2142-N1)-methyltransferase
MAKIRKRKAPVTSANVASGSGLSTAAARPTAPNPASSRARTVIRRFHVLLKRQTQLQALLSKDPSTTKTRRPPGSAEARRELAEVEGEIAALGGLEAYQRMSIAGQGKERGGGSERVLIGWLKEMGVDGKGKGRAMEGGEEKLR